MAEEIVWGGLKVFPLEYLDPTCVPLGRTRVWSVNRFFFFFFFFFNPTYPEGGFRKTDLGADMEFWLGTVLPDTSHPQTPELRGKQDTQ